MAPSTPNDDNGGRTFSRPLLLVCMGVFVLAAVLRCSFVAEVYGQWKALPADSAALREISFINPDSPSFLIPARELLAGRLSRAGSIARPPGYPMFLAALGARYPLILGAQALLGALIAVGIVLVTYAVTERIAVAAGAGFISAVSPTGIGLTGLIMSDGLFALVFTVGVGLLIVAGQRRSRWLLFGSGLAFGAGVMIKPILVMWPPVALVMLWLSAGGTLRPFGKRAIAVFLALQLAPSAIWALRNFVVDDVFTVSSIGVITTRMYIMTRAEARATLGRWPTREEMLQWRSAVSDEGRRQPTIADRLHLFRAQTRAIARKHPKETLQTYVLNTAENLTAGWSWIPSQLPHRGRIHDIGQWAARWEGRFRAAVPLLLTVVLLLTGLRWRELKSPTARISFLTACGMILGWGYFVGVGGMTYWHGSRHLHPTSVFVLATMGIGLASLMTRREDGRVERNET